MLRSMVLTAAVSLTPCCLAAGQSGLPPEGPPVIDLPAINCRAPVPVPVPSGTKSFEDDLTGIRFEYPAYLGLNASWLNFDNPPCGKPFSFGGDIQIRVSLPAKYVVPFYGDPGAVTIETRELKGLDWRHYRTQSDARFCTFAHDEQVCIFAADTSPKHMLPEAAVEAMRTIEGSFIFTDPQNRMDTKIAAMKVGDKVGYLTIRRVVTRAMARRDPKMYLAGRYESFGEVDFAGTLKLTGSIEDIGTMNSPGQYRILPDSENGPRLPFNLEQNLGSRIAFGYPRGLENAIKEVADGNEELWL